MFKISKEIKKFIKPIKIGREILLERAIYNVHYENKIISELSPLVGLHHENIDNAKIHLEAILSNIDVEEVKLNFKTGRFNPEDLFFNLINVQNIEKQSFPSSVIFCIETLLINILFTKEYPPLKYCYLDFSKRISEDKGVVKIKVGRKKIKEEQQIINHYINNTNLFLRLDGNQSLTSDELRSIISNHPTERFQYLEDPFVSDEEAAKYYLNKSKIPLAWDENLNILLEAGFNRHPLKPFVKFAIIKPNLQGGYIRQSRSLVF